jgi:CheY-like chemotaxis protein
MTGGVDLLVSDVMMPRMTGTELANKVKSLFPKMKILFHTAYPESLPVFEGMGTQTIQYIQKPASMMDVQLRVLEMLHCDTGGNPNQRPTILVIDDESEMVTTIRDFLELEGYTIHSATCPLEGIELYAAHWRSIQLVLLDYKMPGICGDVVLQRLRKINPLVHAVLISAHSHLVREKFGEHGITCLWKPFKLQDLGDCVRALVR